MIERVQLIIKAKNLTASQFADEIGIQRSGMSHVLTGRNNPSLEFVQKILRRYPEIDTNWLIFGNGSMYSENLLANANIKVLPDKETAVSDGNDLFSALVPDSGKKTTLEIVPEIERKASENKNIIRDPPLIIPSQEMAKETYSSPGTEISKPKGKVDKIILFYSDNSFEEFLPQK